MKLFRGGLRVVCAVLLAVALLAGNFGVPQTAQAAGSWVKVGGTVAKGDDIFYALTAAKGGTVYVCYTKVGSDNGADFYVKKLDGTKWKQVGGAIEGYCLDFFVADDKLYAGTPWCLYVYSGGKWVKKTTSGLPTNYVVYQWTVSKGIAYAAYYVVDDYSDQYGAMASVYIRKLSGSKWVAQGGRLTQFPYELENWDWYTIAEYKGRLYHASTLGTAVKKYSSGKWITAAKRKNVGGAAVLEKSSDALYLLSTNSYEFSIEHNYLNVMVEKLSKGKMVKQGSTVKADGLYGLETYNKSVYLYHGYNGKLYVKKLKGGKWSPVGSSLSISKTWYGTASLCIAKGTPHVAYVDKSGNLIVRRYKS